MRRDRVELCDVSLLAICAASGASYKECFRMFNPSSKEALVAVVDTWAAAFLQLVLLLPTHPTVVRDVPAMCVLFPCWLMHAY